MHVDRREQYEIERELAARFKAATAEERRGLYSAVYDDLFRERPPSDALITAQRSVSAAAGSRSACSCAWFAPIQSF